MSKVKKLPDPLSEEDLARVIMSVMADGESHSEVEVEKAIGGVRLWAVGAGMLSLLRKGLIRVRWSDEHDDVVATQASGEEQKRIAEGLLVLMAQDD